MKPIVTASLLAAPLFASVAFAYDCTTAHQQPGARHDICRFTTADGLGEGRNLHLLYLKGNTVDTAYFHGKFMAQEIKNSSLPRILSEIEEGIETFPAAQRPLIKAIAECQLGRYQQSVSKDFIAMHNNLERGLNESGVRDFSAAQLLRGSFAVELSIYFDGLSKKLHDDLVGTGLEIASQCGLQIPFYMLADLAGAIFNNPHKVKMGCTGIAASGPTTREGQLIHARNFDTSLLGYFEKEPVVLFQEPPIGNKWVAAAGMGITYPAAISGFNSAGISVSLHELQTEEYRTHVGGRRGAVAGWVATQVLEKANSIDDAWKIVKDTGHFGAWTLFISDAKSNESASIEFTGKRSAITRRTTNGAIGQSNHFLSPDMEGANYEYSYGKTLESRSRLKLVTDDLARDSGQINVPWMMSALAGHRDAFVGLRSFGRTVTKAYTTLSHVMVPARGEFWTTLGDTYPVGLGSWAGIQVNWNWSATGQAPLEILRTERASVPEVDSLPAFRQSMYHYPLAYINYRDHGKSGNDFLKSHEELSKAIALAEQDGIVEFPYLLMRARIGIMAGAAKKDPHPEYLTQAITDLQTIVSEATAHPERFHDYEVGQAYMWLGRAVDLLAPGTAAAMRATGTIRDPEEYYASARDFHTRVAQNESRPYFLYRVMDSYMDRNTGKFKHYTGKDPVEDSIDFVTVE